MWKKLSWLGCLAAFGGNIRAAEPPAPPPAPPSAPPPATAKLFAPPEANPYADPFFAPPDGLPVMDPSRPGSGAGPSDNLVAACAPFRAERLWFAADFYHAAAQGTILPVLVTAAPNGTPFGLAGALGQPSTTVLFGGERALTRFRPGLRANTGIWLTDDKRFGVEGSFLYLGDVERSFAGATGPGGPVLAQPVTLGATGTPFGVQAGLFGSGTISASVRSAVIGGDANFRYGLTTSPLGRLDLLVGYRYLNLRDRVDVTSTNTFAGAPQMDSTVEDHFRTQNQFHGAQVGLGGTHRLYDRLTLTTRVTAAIGVDISDVTIGGRTTSPLGDANGGLLTGPGNIGNFREYLFSVVPEGSAKLGWDFTDRFRVNAGYSFTYWTRVRRAADQIDTTVSAPGRPAATNDTTDYWIQGWTVGLDLRW